MPIRRVQCSNAESSATRPNTLNLQQRALEELLDELDRQPGQLDAAKRRDFVRWPFRKTTIGARVMQAGSESALRVACRNISCGGASVLHSSFLHPGSRVTLYLPVPGGKEEAVEGTVCRCKHVRGLVHEIGVKFTRPIEAKRFLAPPGRVNKFSLERVDPEKLTGTIVLLDDSEMDRRLVQHYLRGTQLRLRPTDNTNEAIAWMREGCDLALIDHDLGPDREDGCEVIKRTQAMGIPVPLVLLTADGVACLPGGMDGCGADAMLARPITQEMVLRAAAEFLLLGANRGPIHSTLSADDPNLALIDGFLSDVRTRSAELAGAIERNDLPRCRSVCAGIMGTAPSMGFDALAEVAERAAASLANTGSVTESRSALRVLLLACDRVRPGVAA